MPSEAPNLPIPKNLKKACDRFRLSPRESQTVTLLTVGETTKSAADRLGISIKTLDIYLHKIRVKTGGRSTLEAVAILLSGKSPVGEKTS